MKKQLIAIALTLMTSTAIANEHVDNNTTKTATAPLSQGEIIKVNKEQQKVTIKHGPLLNLDMPGMTMVFNTADKNTVNEIQKGDLVKFKAELVNGKYTVVHMEKK